MDLWGGGDIRVQLREYIDFRLAGLGTTTYNYGVKSRSLYY